MDIEPKIYNVDWEREDAVEKYGYLFAGMKKRMPIQTEFPKMYESKNTSWRKKAACLGVQTDLFFPGRGEDTLYKQAVKICEGCEVREECLIDALETDMRDPQGVRGGKGSRERRIIRHRWLKDYKYMTEAAEVA